MKYFSLALLIIFFSPVYVLAYEIIAVEQPSPFEISKLTDLKTEQWFVGELEDFPHTFEFILVEPTTINLQVMYPQFTPNSEKMSVLIVKEVERGVTEVMRRTAGKVEWQSYTDSVSGLSFDESPAYDDRLDSGVYRIEISNPTNIGHYVMKFGYEDDDGGYFNTLGDIKNLRNSLGLSTLGMITNKYVFVPLFTIFSLTFFIWFWRRRR